MAGSKNNKIGISATERFREKGARVVMADYLFVPQAVDVVTAFLRECLYTRTETNYPFYK